jgi:hypothetical protein
MAQDSQAQEKGHGFPIRKFALKVSALGAMDRL